MRTECEEVGVLVMTMMVMMVVVGVVMVAEFSRDKDAVRIQP